LPARSVLTGGPFMTEETSQVPQVEIGGGESRDLV